MRLLDYLPEFLRRYREYQYIFDDADQPEVDAVNDRAEKLYNNMFVVSADEDGIARYEKMLEIVPPTGATLEERRASVLAAMKTDLPYTETKLREILETLCGEGNSTLSVYPNDYRVDVEIAKPSGNMKDSVVQALDRILPANLGYNVAERDSMQGDLYIGIVGISSENISSEVAFHKRSGIWSFAVVGMTTRETFSSTIELGE